MVSLMPVSTVLLILTISGTKIVAHINETNKEKSLEDAIMGKKLYDAASHGNLAEVKTLSQNQCIGVNWQDVFNSTPLHTAALHNHLEVVMFLLSCNCDPNKQTVTGWTPLMYASRSADVDVVNALLTANPDLDVQKFDGWTALMLASNTNRVENTKALITAGANLGLRNRFGKTAGDFAMKRGSMEISQLIMQGTVNKTTNSTNTMFMLDMWLAMVFFIVVFITVCGFLYIASKIIIIPSSIKSLKIFTIEEDREILHFNKD